MMYGKSAAESASELRLSWPIHLNLRTFSAPSLLVSASILIEAKQAPTFTMRTKEKFPNGIRTTAASLRLQRA